MAGLESEWIDVEVRRETSKAVLLHNGKREAWIPKSQIIDSDADLGEGVETKVELPVWLLEKEELV